MEVSNASHYDGATSTAEAVIMALNVAQGTRRGVILSAGVHPQYRAVVRTYTQGMKLEIRGDDADRSAEDLAGLCDSSTACVIVQNPDFFGRIIPPGSMAALAQKVHDCGALLVSVVNPITLGVLVPPGELGVDVAVGEGQALGNTLSFGGPYLGFFAFRREHVRKSSGRIAGETVDRAGRRGFVFTLSTREQHIRREKATSNICTNQSLNALAAAVYLAALGPRGLRQVAELCWHKAHYAAKSISKIRGYTVGTTGESNGAGGFFHEFVVRCPLPADEINRRLFTRHGIIGGYALGAEFPDRKNDMILCCTEMNTREEIDFLAASLREVGNA
jgi:glycine dehydrogenase subunit 1